MINPKLELNKALKNKYAIGAFNVCNLETFQSVKSASFKSKMPVFLATSNKSISYMGLDNIINLSNGLKNSKVILHLDHGDYKNSVNCIKKGYPSVMFDGSMFDLKKNIRLTKKVVSLAEKSGVCVEAEIGALRKDGLTIPDEAKHFVDETGVDSLAVSLGNEHGYYKYLPVLDIKRLKEIKELVKIPLVLHGASGLSNTIIKEVIKNHICKINIDTEIRWAYSKSVNDFFLNNSLNQFNKETFDIRNYSNLARSSVESKVLEKIRLFHA